MMATRQLSKRKCEHGKDLWHIKALAIGTCGQTTTGSFGDGAPDVAAAMALLVSDGYAKDDITAAKVFLRDLEQTLSLWH